MFLKQTALYVQGVSNVVKWGSGRWSRTCRAVSTESIIRVIFTVYFELTSMCFPGKSVFSLLVCIFITNLVLNFI